MRLLHLLLAASVAIPSSGAWGQSALEECADRFIGGLVENAPTIGGSASSVPFRSNLHLCYRDDGVSFFAIEYWPEQFAPRWAAYRLDPTDYGLNGCATYTRDRANCYFTAGTTWEEFENCEEAGDPFHADLILQACASVIVKMALAYNLLHGNKGSSRGRRVRLTSRF